MGGLIGVNGVKETGVVVVVLMPPSKWSDNEGSINSNIDITINKLCFFIANMIFFLFPYVKLIYYLYYCKFWFKYNL